MNYYSPKEIAVELGVTEETVRRWLRKGLLVGFKSYKLWRINEESLQRFINNGSNRVLSP